MAGNSFGKLFRITTFGESHGPAIGVVIDGCPANLCIDLEEVQNELNRRRPGQSALVTKRDESDRVQVLSGIFENRTTGAPIALLMPNEDARSKDYSHLKDTFRPSHADFTYQSKYGHRDYRGGGRSSARETAARVAAGAIAKQYLQAKGIYISGWVSPVGRISCTTPHTELNLSLTEASPVRCPEPATAAAMINHIQEVKKAGDSVGGIVSCVVTGCPAGLGEPVFDKLHAELGKAMLGINACKGFEIGSGFAAASMLGSDHNDLFSQQGEQIVTKTNYSGGVQGGISNGMDVYFRCAFKPVATILQEQESVDAEGNTIQLQGKGRHDPCVVPRAVPIVEAMAALVVMDYHLLQFGIK